MEGEHAERGKAVNRPAAEPSHADLFNPVLAALKRLGGSASIPELNEAVISDTKPNQDVLERPHSGRTGQTELEYRLAWARTYLKKYGLFENSTRGVWSLTPRGSEIGSVDSKDVVRAVRALSAAEQEAQRPVESSEEVQEPVQ